MAACVVTFECRIAWWVQPYLWVACLFVQSVAPFLMLDDGRLDGFIERQVNFVTKHGVHLYCNGKRV